MNVDLLLKLLYVLPPASLYLAFAIVEDAELYFFYGFIAFWLFGLGSVVYPLVETCHKHGCKPRVVLSTPINTIFTNQEVTAFFQRDVKKCLLRGQA